LGGRKSLYKTEWWDAGVVVCLERSADLHMAQLMPLPLTVACFDKIQIGFIFLVPARPSSPEKPPLNGCNYVLQLLETVYRCTMHIAFIVLALLSSVLW